MDLKAKTNAVAYDRLKMWVLKKELVPTTIECYAATGMLIKTLKFRRLKTSATRWCGRGYGNRKPPI